ncbi:MAG: hypothetical protein P1R58_00195 [bacterium]|nr:hypothetical protein [bacterium]
MKPTRKISRLKPLRLSIMLTATLAVTASGFDGVRQGFVLGGGLGIGPAAHTSADLLPDTSTDRTGLALNFVIGYALNEKNLLAYFEDAVVFSTSVTSGKNLNFVQGFSGVGWQHYFGLDSRAYIVGGLGLQSYISPGSDYDSHDPGFGLLLGGGYEFRRHLQIHTSFSFGKTSDSAIEYNHSQFVITIAALAY